MRRLILVFGVLITLTALFTTAPRPVVAQSSSCDLTAQLCRTIASNLYNLCVAQGGTASDCAWDEAKYTLQCLKNGGCEPILD